MKSYSVDIGGRTADCAEFGRGEIPLLLLPGLGDGLRTVKGAALPLALSCRELTRRHTVYALSRVNELTDGYSISDMAIDAVMCMTAMGIGRFDLLGVSMGGMIAQLVASGYPDNVRRMVLAVTAASSEAAARDCISRWIGWAESGEYRQMMIDTAEKTYSEGYLKKLRPAYPLLFRKSKRDMSRFIIQAKACAGHDAVSELSKITAPTLIIGGGEDRIVGPGAAKTLAESISGARLYEYPALGHGLFDEAKDFYRRAESFFEE